MKATVTSKGQITIPLAIRRKLKLHRGTVLEFDEGADHLKATKSVDVDRMRAVIGIARDKLAGKSVDGWMEELRGRVLVWVVIVGWLVVVCDVVAAEFFALLLDEAAFQRSLGGLGVAFSPTSLESARLAGRIFRTYRSEGGPREHLVPDFLVGAHAQRQADRIAAIDRGYLRRYFPRLRILKPA